MPYEWVEPEVFVTCGGFNVYHVYKNDFANSGCRAYWFTLTTWGSDDDDMGQNGCFDVRELPNPRNLDVHHSEDAKCQVIEDAIDAGYFKDWNISERE